MYDIITIGGATQDIFVETDKAQIMKIETVSSKESRLCFDYGAKIEADNTAYDIGGGAANAAVNFAGLGFNTGIIVKLGKDLTAGAVLQRLKEKNVDDSMIIHSKTEKTGFSIILTSYEGDRTVIMDRGANSTIKESEIDFEKINHSKWLYAASLSGKSNLVLDKIAEYAEENGVNMAVNPGSAQLKRGTDNLKKILEKAEILILNRSEAAILTGILNNPPEYPSRSDNNLKDMLCKIKTTCPNITVITEGKRGAYAYDGEKLFYCPTFPTKVVSTLGAGDAFSSTFVAGMIKYDNNIEKSLKIASINSASVVQSFGAQSGLQNFDELEKIYDEAENYEVIVQVL